MAETLIRSVCRHTQRAVGGTTVVELRGEIDVLAAPSLTTCLDDLTASAHPDVVVDLRAVSFIDCAGLAPLCRARNRIAQRHGRLRLVCDSDRVLRVMKGAGLSDVFEIQDRLPEALTGAPREVFRPQRADQVTEEHGRRTPRAGLRPGGLAADGFDVGPGHSALAVWRRGAPRRVDQSPASAASPLVGRGTAHSMSVPVGSR
ncbi:STAS domain-containing protein [Streptomyces misionensis]|uniref:STAS domain-containing protein n=1 Tax=Streptomyces misionensis TaxID=67331 RepID=UPI00368A0CE4